MSDGNVAHSFNCTPVYSYLLVICYVVNSRTANFENCQAFRGVVKRLNVIK